MHLMRLGPIGAEIPAVGDGDNVYDLRPLVGRLDGAFLASGGIARVREALAAAETRNRG